MDPKTIKRQLKLFTDATDAEVKLFASGLQKFLERNLNQLLRDLERGDIKAAEAANLLGALFSNLRQRGLDNYIENVRHLFANQLDRMQTLFTTFTKEKAVFTSQDITTFETMIKFHEDKVFSTVGTYVDDTKAAFMQTVIAGGPIDVSQVVANVSDRIESNITTEFTTALMGFNRAVNMAKADDFGLSLFWYEGPDDDLTRPFCAEHVGGVYTKEDIAKWDNGTDLDPAIYLGGYNCRHQLVPVTEKYAKEELDWNGNND